MKVTCELELTEKQKKEIALEWLKEYNLTFSDISIYPRYLYYPDKYTPLDVSFTVDTDKGYDEILKCNIREECMNIITYDLDYYRSAMPLLIKELRDLARDIEIQYKVAMDFDDAEDGEIEEVTSLIFNTEKIELKNPIKNGLISYSDVLNILELDPIYKFHITYIDNSRSNMCRVVLLDGYNAILNGNMDFTIDVIDEGE